MLTPRIMKLHRYIDHVWQMTPIDFQVTKSKVKFTVTKKRIHTMTATTTDSPYGGHAYDQEYQSFQISYDTTLRHLAE
ncbi:hypothetical protein DPMN_002325 [Dreissena polymorpha]|uniref:Uncharacterized protein n=1 Tax=Dreissena polymorpha TaxID=45954 RepID=A0A9D4RTV7_DREPO|nr:hypothetical protein DPMN_002325 [Dreissena polymorpha]